MSEQKSLKDVAKSIGKFFRRMADERVEYEGKTRPESMKSTDKRRGRDRDG